MLQRIITIRIGRNPGSVKICFRGSHAPFTRLLKLRKYAPMMVVMIPMIPIADGNSWVRIGDVIRSKIGNDEARGNTKEISDWLTVLQKSIVLIVLHTPLSTRIDQKDDDGLVGFEIISNGISRKSAKTHCDQATAV